MKVACTNVVAAPRFHAKRAAHSPLPCVNAPQALPRQTTQNASTRLRQDPVDHMTGDVGQPEVAPLVAVSQPLMIDP